VIKTEGLTHIHLVVRDLDRSLAFYQQAFGMEERFRDGPNLVFVGTPGRGDSITLNQSASDRALAGNSGGVAHFGFRRVDGQDLDDAIAEIERAGGRLLERGEHALGVPYAYVEDPDGYVIEL
jgi:catechol 2,3-dioxygenase-like lactoylglutathione lyase family enzyme